MIKIQTVQPQTLWVDALFNRGNHSTTLACMRDIFSLAYELPVKLPTYNGKYPVIGDGSAELILYGRSPSEAPKQRWNYSGIMRYAHLLRQFLISWDFGLSLPSRENPVFHDSLRGWVSVDPTGSRFKQYYASNAANESALKSVSLSHTPFGDVISLHEGVISTPYQLPYNMEEGLEFIYYQANENPGHPYKVNRVGNEYTWTVAMEYVILPTEIRIKEARYLTWLSKRHWCSFNHYRIVPNTISSVSEYDEESPLSSYVNFTVDWRKKVVYDKTRSNLDLAYYTLGLDSEFAAAPLLGDLSYYDSSVDLKRWTSVNTVASRAVDNSFIENVIGFSNDKFNLSSGQTFKGFENVVSDIMPDALPLASLVSNDAIENAFGDVSFSLTEFLSEFSDVTSLINLSEVAFRFQKMVRGGHFRSISGIKNLLGILSDASLVYSFGLVPTAASASDIAGEAHRLVSLLSDSLWIRDIRGKDTFDIPSHLNRGYEGLRVTVRTKVRIKINPDSILPSLLTLNSFGLLPTLSGFWEIIPFSFLFDSFLNFGEGLEQVEKTLLMAAMDIQYSVCSYCFHYTLTESDLNDYGKVTVVEPSSDNWPAYRSYNRIVYDTLPVMAPSRLLTEELFAGYVLPFHISGPLAYKVLT